MIDKEAVIIVAIFAAVFALLIGTVAYVRIGTENSLRACRDRGGHVDYFDPAHADNWRCVGATAERAP